MTMAGAPFFVTRWMSSMTFSLLPDPEDPAMYAPRWKAETSR
jgi:hypothetical protein